MKNEVEGGIFVLSPSFYIFIGNYAAIIKRVKMKKILLLMLPLFIASLARAQKNISMEGYPISPVPFTSVKVTDHFWGERLEASRKVTIPLAFSKCEETGRYENFVKAAHPSDNYKVGGYTFGYGCL